MQLVDITTTKAFGSRRTMVEIFIVFALSLGASAVYSAVSLIAKLTAPTGLAGQTSRLNQSLSEREWLDLSYQLLGIIFGLAPVALVIFLLWDSASSGLKKIGLDLRRFRIDLLAGLAIAAAIGVPGIALYLGARALGLSSRVEPASLGTYWWVVPILLLAALKAALLEEVIVVGYLHNRLSNIGISANKILWFSAVIRASYHLYQGFAGFVGNLVMGLVFMKIYQRTGRTTALVVAHFLMDAFVFVGYALLAKLISLL
jgi:membrane protease YdiL (CAAX protease family)